MKPPVDETCWIGLLIACWELYVDVARWKIRVDVACWKLHRDAACWKLHVDVACCEHNEMSLASSCREESSLPGEVRLLAKVPYCHGNRKAVEWGTIDWSTALNNKYTMSFQTTGNYFSQQHGLVMIWFELPNCIGVLERLYVQYKYFFSKIICFKAI